MRWGAETPKDTMPEYQEMEREYQGLNIKAGGGVKYRTIAAYHRTFPFSLHSWKNVSKFCEKYMKKRNRKIRNIRTFISRM